MTNHWVNELNRSPMTLTQHSASATQSKVTITKYNHQNLYNFEILNWKTYSLIIITLSTPASSPTLYLISVLEGLEPHGSQSVFWLHFFLCLVKSHMFLLLITTSSSPSLSTTPSWNTMGLVILTSVLLYFHTKDAEWDLREFHHV